MCTIHTHTYGTSLYTKYKKQDEGTGNILYTKKLFVIEQRVITISLSLSVVETINICNIKLSRLCKTFYLRKYLYCTCVVTLACDRLQFICRVVITIKSIRVHVFRKNAANRVNDILNRRYLYLIDNYELLSIIESSFRHTKPLRVATSL